MKQNPKSEGKCLFCGETFAKAGIIRHLQGHLKQKVEKGKPGQSYLVKVEPASKWDSAHYFLALWVDSSATLGNVDDFLRAIWLECCGHLSAFTYPKNWKKGGGKWDFFAAQELLRSGKQKDLDDFMDEQEDEITKSWKVNKMFYSELKLGYEYDFGSTTDLSLTVVKDYPIKADKKIVLLSRNEPLEWLCDACKKEPATQICTVHDWDEDSLFCEKCAKKHAKSCEDFGDYAAMPVVNSPRMGICAYNGGAIDTERDGAFVKK